MAAQAQFLTELVIRARDEASRPLTQISNSTKTLQSSLSSLKTQLAGALSVTAVVAFAKSVVDLAGHLQDLSDQTGISTKTLSGIKSTLEQSGTSLDAFAKGIFTAQRNLGLVNEESDQAALAVKALGLNLDELRNASPDRFLELVAAALAKIENTVQRNALGAQLLGRSFRELAPALSEIAGRFEELRRQGLSEADIKRLDQFGDSITRLTNSLKLALAPELAHLANMFDFFTGKMTRLQGMQAQLARAEGQLQGLRESRKSFLGGLLGPQIDKQIQEKEKEIEILRNQIEIIKPPERQAVPFVPPSGAGSARGRRGGDDAARAAEEAARAAEEAAQRNRAFAESLKQSNDQLALQIILLEQGPEAAAAFEQQLLAAKAAVDGLTDEEEKQLKINNELTQGVKKLKEEYERLVRAVDATRGGILEEEHRFGLTPEESRQALGTLGAGRPAEDGTLERRSQEWARTITGPFHNALVRAFAEGEEQFADILKMGFASVLSNVSDKLLEENLTKPLEDSLIGMFQSIISSLSGSLTSASGGGGLSSILSWLAGFFLLEKGGVMPGQFIPIRAFAGGGVVDRPTFGLIGEGVTKEAVVPLSGGRNIPVELREGKRDRDRAPQVGVEVKILGNIVPHPMVDRKQVVQVVVHELNHNTGFRQSVKSATR
ncbi:MAG TPA: hypothetical protein VNN13_07405 [Methylomirabilota bacterium]|nr:hypothetical protein [Methylomirabilota bacterium]